MLRNKNDDTFDAFHDGDENCVDKKKWSMSYLAHASLKLLFFVIYEKNVEGTMKSFDEKWELFEVGCRKEN